MFEGKLLSQLLCWYLANYDVLSKNKSLSKNRKGGKGYEKNNKRIKQLLEEQKMFDVIRLMDEGADNERIVEAFENHVLSKSTRYQKWMKTLQSAQKNVDINNNQELEFLMGKLKERIIRRSEYRKIYRLLKQ